jgi:phage terminase large subunit-like protein
VTHASTAAGGETNTDGHGLHRDVGVDQCVAFPQSDARMIPASQRLHRAVVEQRLCVPDDPVLARHAANAVARQSRRGWRLDRPSRQAGVNIDALVALAMAVDAAECQQPATELLGWL